MADRYLSDLEDDNLDRGTGDAVRRRESMAGGAQKKRRIRVTQNGMPDNASSQRSAVHFETELPPRARAYSEYQPVQQEPNRTKPAFDEHGEAEYDEYEPEHHTKRSVQQPSYPEPIPRAMQYDDRRYARRPSFPIPSGPRMPQLPIRGGLSELVGRGRVAMALLMSVLAFVGYNLSGSYTNTNSNTTTRQSQHAISQPVVAGEQSYVTQPSGTQPPRLLREHEVALGQKTADEVLNRHFGFSKNNTDRRTVKEIGDRLVRSNDAARSGYEFSFDVLADDRTIDAFGLPGGRVYLTTGLYNRLTTAGEVAAMLAYQMAHVTQRHGVLRLANESFSGGNRGHIVMASFLDPSGFPTSANEEHELVVETARLTYDEAEVDNSDKWAIQYMTQAGFDPNSLITALQTVSQPKGQPSQFSLRHPAPASQLALIQQRIQQLFPDGIPNDSVK